MKFLNPFPYIVKSKFDFDFDNKLRGKVEGHIAAAREQIEYNDFKTLEQGGGTTSVVIIKIILPHVWDEFEDFRPWLYSKVDHIWEMWKLQPMIKHLSDSWINEHPPGAWTAEHHHQNVTLAIACYLDVPKDSGRLMVKNPFAMYKLGEPLATNYYDENMQWEYIEVKTNDVLFFPGWLTHKTEVNHGKDNRYVMSLNIMGNYVNNYIN